MARFFALVTAALAAATIVSGQVTSPLGSVFQPGRGANIGTDVYFPDTAGHVIVKMTSAGVMTVVAGVHGQSGQAEGNTTDRAARFNAPQGVCTDGTDLWVADTGNHKIRKIVLSSGQTSTPFGPAASTTAVTASDNLGSTAVPNTGAGFSSPTDCAFITAANMYIADSGNRKIKKAVVATGALTLHAGTGTNGNTDGNAATGTFNTPAGLCTDGTDLWVTDTGNHNVRKVLAADGTSSLAAGGAVSGFANDAATPANVRFNVPSDCLYTGTANNFLVADRNNHAIRRIVSATGTVAAGQVGTGVAGDANAAAGADAKLWGPVGLVGDAATNAASTNVHILEADGRRVRKLVGVASPAGAVSLVGGTINSVFPFNPYSCTHLTDTYCTDNVRHVVWKIVDATGVTTVFAGTEATSGDAEGAAGTGRLNAPTGITNDGTNLFVADTGNHKIRMVTVASGALSTPAGFGPAAGCTTGCSGTTLAADTTARYNGPKGVAIYGTDLYIADTANHRIVKIPKAGGGAGGTLFSGSTGNSGDADGNLAASRYNAPEGICVVGLGGAGNEGFLVADTGNHKFKAVTAAGTGLGFPAANEVATYYGSGTAGDSSTTGQANMQFRSPKGCAADKAVGAAATAITLVDSGNNKIKIAGVETTAGTRTITRTIGPANQDAGDVVSGTAANNRWSNPVSAVRTADTHVLVADAGNREIKYVALAGTATARGTAGGAQPHGVTGALPSATAPGSNPFVSTATSVDGSVAMFHGVREAASLTNVAGVETSYLVDSANHVIRRVVFNITSSASTVSTFLGTAGTSGDSASLFNGPTAIVANGTDTLYVADTGNHKIKKIVVASDGTATVTVFAGPAFGTQQAADVIAADATVRFSSPQGLAIAAGNLFVADTGNNKIKQITPAGAVTIVWGAAATGTGAATGAGDVNSATAASNTFSAPKGLASNGTHIFVADSGSNKIRVCTVGSGTCANFAGPAQATITPGTADAAPGAFSNPTGLSFDQFGNLYVADTGNHKIRKITSAGVITTVVGTAAGTAGSAGAADQATATSAGVYATATLNGPTYVWFARSQPTLAFISDTANNRVRVAAGLGTAAVTVTATATQTNTTTTTVTNTTTATVTTTANTTTAATTSTASNATTVAPTTTAARGSSNAVVAAATAVIVAVLAIFA